MNWGKGLALAMIAFALLMAWFVYKASQHTEPLVTENYYAAELKYQERIDEMARAKRLSAPVHMSFGRDGVDLQFPPEFNGRRITGKLELLRPNNPLGDRELAVSTDSASVHLPTDLMAGRYNASLQWEVEGITYFSSDKAYIP